MWARSSDGVGGRGDGVDGAGDDDHADLREVTA